MDDLGRNARNVAALSDREDRTRRALLTLYGCALAGAIVLAAVIGSRLVASAAALSATPF